MMYTHNSKFSVSFLQRLVLSCMKWQYDNDDDDGGGGDDDDDHDDDS